MTSIEPGLYLRVEEMENGPKPLPSVSGFSTGRAYRALGLYNPSETSDAYFVLSNDRDEVWFICNRHLRTCALMPDERKLRLSLSEQLTGGGALMDANAFLALSQTMEGRDLQM